MKNRLLVFSILLTVFGCSNVVVNGQIQLSSSTVSSNTTYNDDVIILANQTVTFTGGIEITITGDLTLQPNSLLIVDGITLKMGTDKRIIVSHANPYSSILRIQNGSIVTSISGSGALWRGIEFTGTTTLSGTEGKVEITNSTLQYATCAVNNFAPATNGSWNGSIRATGATFLNNLRCVRLERANSFSTVVGNPDLALNSLVYFDSCRFETTSLTPPPDLVYLNNCTAVPFRSCSFLGSDLAYTTGINAINAGFRVERFNSQDTVSLFDGLRNGILVFNSLAPAKRPLIRDGRFICRYGINLNGCLSPLIVGNSFNTGSNNITSWDYNCIFLRNCTSYRVEANSLHYDPASDPDGFTGIVVMNSGVANNEIYRNLIGSCNLGIQSIGTNKNTNGTTGLKILCNNIYYTYLDDFYDISIMADPTVALNNGVHNNQFMQTGSGNLSAANRFNYSYGPGTSGPRHYYLEAGTNNNAQFVYRYNSSISAENPIFRNFTNLFTSSNNSCPVHTPGGPLPPFPFSSYISRLQDLEDSIGTLEATSPMTASDSAALDYTLGLHWALIDSTLMRYQDLLSTDSIIMALQPVTKGYHYQVLLAAAYASKDLYDDAADVLTNISSNYGLSAEEEDQIDHLIEVYDILKWLYENDYDWGNLSETSKGLLYDYSENDAMYAGAISRMLIVEYDSREYDPIYIMPDTSTGPISYPFNLSSDKTIYPNPVKDKLIVNASFEGGTLVIKSIRGETMIASQLKKNTTIVPVTKLSPGIYIVQIIQGNKVLYTRKIVKE